MHESTFRSCLPCACQTLSEAADMYSLVQSSAKPCEVVGGGVVSPVTGEDRDPGEGLGSVHATRLVASQ